jgi:small-conductance mechanosensitive channel/CRP-like cAMP-binding protein
MMHTYLAAGLGPTLNTFFVSLALIGIGLLSARYCRASRPLVYFCIQSLVLASLTVLMLARDIVPYRPAASVLSAPERLLVGFLEILWWLAAAWLTAGFLRAFVILGRKPTEAKLVQDLLAALIYLAAMVAIVANVFDLPVKGLLATSGALAIVIGLALQSSLSDVFSGIVLNLERPYRVGDWIKLDDTLQGTVLETNWRATHILTSSSDIAIIPNSAVAKSRLINCSTPTKMHSTTARIMLEAALTPAVGCDLMREVLLGSSHVLRTPEPTVTIKDVSADMIEFELGFSVAHIGLIADAQNELFDRVYRAVAAAGIRFASRLAPLSIANVPQDTELATPSRLIAGISLFSTLTDSEKAALASQMTRKDYKPGEVIVQNGTVVQALNIISYGVLVATEEQNGHSIERLRLTPGIYFGETGLLTGQALSGQITALTRAVIYEISKDAMLPLLNARPGMAEELSELLASRQLARRTVLDLLQGDESHQEGLASRVAATIRHLFSLH